jgi:hypothetical protein
MLILSVTLLACDIKPKLQISVSGESGLPELVSIHLQQYEAFHEWIGESVEPSCALRLAGHRQNAVNISQLPDGWAEEVEVLGGPVLRMELKE